MKCPLKSNNTITNNASPNTGAILKSVSVVEFGKCDEKDCPAYEVYEPTKGKKYQECKYNEIFGEIKK